MLRFFYILVTAVALCTIAHAQWVRQAPYPANRDLQGVYFVTPDIGFISGDDQILMRTTDGGQTFTQAAEVIREPFGMGQPNWDIQFLDTMNGYALGNPLRSWRTNDGGATWQLIQTPLGPLGMDFISPTSGIIFDRRAAFTTQDSGATWTASIPDSLDHFVMDIDFYDSESGLAVGEISNVTGVFRSTNFGQAWQQISTQSLDRVLFLTENIVIGSYNSSFFRSVDGGVTWTSGGAAFNPQSQTEIEAITKVSNSSAAAVCFDHSIWMTHDSGVTWTRVKEPTGVWGFELDIHFVTPQVGYSVGRGGLIYKTTDGGATWTQMNNGIARHLLDVKMRQSGLGLAVGEDGVMVRTTDFGNNWVASQMKGEGKFWHIGDLHTIEFIDEDTVVVGGQYGRVFRSEDAGLTWTQQIELGGNAEVLDTFFLNENEGWIATILNSPRGSIEHTTDGGLTWTRLVDGDPYPTRLHMFNDNQGLALIRPYSQLRTVNKFNNVTVEILTQEDQWIDMEFIGDLGWYGGVSGHIMRTADRGVTRIESILPDWQIFNDALTDIDALTPTRVLAAARRSTGLGSGRIYESNDGGVNWTTLPTITTQDSQLGSLILAIDAFESGPIWAVSHRGYIFRLGEVRAPVQPTTFEIVRGSVVSGGTLASVLHSDDVRIVLRPGITFATSQDPVVLEFTGNAGLKTPSELRLLVESSATSTNLQIKTEMYDYDAEAFVQVGAVASTTTDTTQTFIRSDADRWLSPTGEVKCRISYRATGPVFAYPWNSRLDMVRWQVQ